MASEGEHGAQTSGEYIAHHLQNLQVCKADGEWIWNHCAGNPMAINVDSMFFSVALGLVFWTGVIFLVLSATPIRVLMIEAIPHHLRGATAAGIGLLEVAAPH